MQREAVTDSSVLAAHQPPFNALFTCLHIDSPCCQKPTRLTEKLTKEAGNGFELPAAHLRPVSILDKWLPLQGLAPLMTRGAACRRRQHCIEACLLLSKIKHTGTCACLAWMCDQLPAKDHLLVI